jgi:glycine cleavage system H protein
MFGHDPYAARAIEYLLGLSFLLFFAAFWRYAMAGTSVSLERVVARVRRALPFADMFQVPEGVRFHPGHAWARADAPDLVTVGMDDFAQQLVGPIAAIATPGIGTAIEQGARLATLRADSKSVDLLSPISGQVVAVNGDVRGMPRAINDDPYGRGWLIKVRTPRWPVESKQLLHGSLARRWMSSSWDELSTMMTPELGTIMHDGGTPVHGLARAIDETHWDEIARRFLLSEEPAVADVS